MPTSPNTPLHVVPPEAQLCERNCCRNCTPHRKDAEHEVFIGRSPEYWEVVVTVGPMNQTVWVERNREDAFLLATHLISFSENPNFRLNFYESRVKDAYDLWAGATGPGVYSIGEPERVGPMPPRQDIPVSSEGYLLYSGGPLISEVARAIGDAQSRENMFPDRVLVPLGVSIASHLSPTSSVATVFNIPIEQHGSVPFGRAAVLCNGGTYFAFTSPPSTPVESNNRERVLHIALRVPSNFLHPPSLMIGTIEHFERQSNPSSGDTITIRFIEGTPPWYTEP